MQKLVIQSKVPMEVGRTYQNITDPKAIRRPGQIVYVIAESTREEWIECMVSFGEEREHAEMLSSLDPYFYEIRTD